MLVGVRVLLCRSSAKAGRLADERLVDVFPEGARVDEHLVVEARRQEPRELAVVLN